MANTRVRTGILFFLILAAFLIGSIWLPWLIVTYFTLVIILCGLEIYHALQNKFRPLSITSILIGSLTMLTPGLIWFIYRDLRQWHILSADDLPLNESWSSDYIWLLAYGVLVFFCVYVLYALLNVLAKILAKGVEHMPHAVAESSAVFYLAVPFSVVVLFQYAVPNGFYWLVFALITPMIVDVSAYYAGSLLGRKKMLPRISPHKTWVGFFGGLFGGVLFGALFFMILFRGPEPMRSIGEAVIFGCIAGLIVGLAAQFGDWIASALKRWCQIKDFSNLLPGHGGMLDRFDSVLYSLPVTLVLSIVFYLLELGA